MNGLVLVVDDDALVRRVLVRELRASFTVHDVGSYAEAAEELGARGGELVAVVTDLHLDAGRTGIELLEVVASRWPLCARVLVSGNLDAAAIRSLELAETAQRALAKPWPPGAVLAAALDLISSAAALDRTAELAAGDSAEGAPEAEPPEFRLRNPGT